MDIDSKITWLDKDINETVEATIIAFRPGNRSKIRFEDGSSRIVSNEELTLVEEIETVIPNNPDEAFLDEEVEKALEGIGETNSRRIRKEVAKKELKSNGQIKPRMSLVPPKALEEVARVFTFGAEKYGAHNFSKGRPVSDYIDAALRHITKYNSGKDLDDESKLSHLAHAVCCLMMNLDNTLIGTAEDDRNPAYK